MIEYIIDKEKKYLEDILFHLRAHNKSHTGEKKNESKHIYVHDKNELLGAVTINYSWDWAGFGDIFYKDLDVLKELIYRAIKLYKETSVGIKTYTQVSTLQKDLEQVGFKEVGSLNQTKYLDLVDYTIQSENEYTVIESEEESEQFHPVFKKHSEAFKTKHNLPVMLDELSVVALDNNSFAGGVTLQIYKETMYVHLLVVNKEYRGHNIGSTLMHMAEEEANKRNVSSIDLGTVEFQARPFYEKLGYEVVFTRQDFPKGYECYTLNKTLKRSEKI